MKSRLARTLLLLTLAMHAAAAIAQDLEPRRWSHLPAGLNVFGVGIAGTDGEIFLDPALRIEDANFELYGGVVSYVHAFGVLGKSSRIDVLLPYANGRWEGLVDGAPTTVRRSGLADPRLRFSISLHGAPALSGREFLQYRRAHPVSTTVGAALEVTLPIGEYSSDRLINLGANRVVLRPQLGILHQRHDWQFELTGSAFLYRDNEEFWQGSKLEQDPLWFIQAHVIRSFRPGWWASLSGGFAYGGATTVNGVAKNDDARSRYAAVNLGMPLSASQALKFSFLSAETNVLTGRSTNVFSVAWSVNWGR